MGLVDATQIKQIKYSINFLTQTGFYIMDRHDHGKGTKADIFNKEVSLMDIFKDTEELEIFDTEAI